MAELLHETAAFRQWAGQYPSQARSGEWECDYPRWTPLYMAVLEFVAAHPWADWSREEREAVLYAVARDNETQYLASEIRADHPETLLRLTGWAIDRGEPDAKWQLAEEIVTLAQSNVEVESLLVALANDPDEYVRRRALSGLARLGSEAVEELAMAAWNRPDANQQWARMNVLWSLHRVGSPLLERLLVEAERSKQPYISDYAKRVREGRLES